MIRRGGRAAWIFMGGWAMAQWLHAAPLPSGDRRYLAGVYRETWACLAHFVSPQTGLPYDSSRRLKGTSTTNIGLYLAACAVAGRTGVIPAPEAHARIDRALASVDQLPRFLGGFPVTWVNVDTLEPTERQFSTVDHLSNLTAGLLAVKGIFPEFAARVDKLLTPMDWGALYDPATRWYRGGWRLDKSDFDVKQKGWDWHYSYLGADTRFGSVWGIATGHVPAESWGALNRGLEAKYNFSYYVPGWQGGGLFMQFITGLFLDERTTVIGKSAADFAWVQIQHAQRIGAPVWGWSASESPDGREYLGWGAISDSVVTPHAVGLAAVYYPRTAAVTLRAFEKRKVRAPFRDERRSYDFGFRDSLNWRTGEVSQAHLCLDQSMMFLSLANLLHDGIVWKAVGSDPHLQRVLKEMPEYAAADPSLSPLYDERDRTAPRAPPSKRSSLSLD